MNDIKESSVLQRFIIDLASIGGLDVTTEEMNYYLKGKDCYTVIEDFKVMSITYWYNKDTDVLVARSCIGDFDSHTVYGEDTFGGDTIKLDESEYIMVRYNHNVFAFRRCIEDAELLGYVRIGSDGIRIIGMKKRTVSRCIN